MFISLQSKKSVVAGVQQPPARHANDCAEPFPPDCPNWLCEHEREILVRCKALHVARGPPMAISAILFGGGVQMDCVSAMNKGPSQGSSSDRPRAGDARRGPKPVFDISFMCRGIPRSVPANSWSALFAVDQ